VNTLNEWFKWFRKIKPLESEYRIKRIQLVADRMGLRDCNVPIITVAGTNGKGSTIACLESMFISAEQIPGVYTSPHIVKYNERICVGGKTVGNDMIVKAFSEIEHARMLGGKIALNSFEFEVLAAAWCFRELNASPWILEVGIGGVNDAVACFDCDVGIITSISLDHLYIQGDTVEKIGRHEAGIVRPGRPIICSDPEPPHTVCETINDGQGILYQLNKDYYYAITDNSWSFYSNNNKYIDLPCPYWLTDKGIANAAGAVAAVSGIHPDLFVGKDTIHNGLKNAKLAGRHHFVETDKSLWLLDVAHNPSSINMLLEKINSESIKGKKRIVFACHSDKQIDSIIKLLASIIDEWFLLTLDSSKQHILHSTSDIKQILKNYNQICVGEGNIDKAIEMLESKYEEGDLNIAAGSFSVIRQFMKNGIGSTYK
jgi:dihydrofolate synthase/folylpolyglutamate synthase